MGDASERTAHAGSREPAASDDAAALRMLYYVGAGPTSVHRVDVSDLFGKRLAHMGLAINWYHASEHTGPPAGAGEFLGRPARVCGTSALPGLPGRIASKLYAYLAAFHFFGAALRSGPDIIQVRDDFLAGVLGLLAARIRHRRFVFWLSYPFPEARLAEAREGRSRSALYAWLAGNLSAAMLYRVILPLCDIAVVQSEQMRRDVIARGADPLRLEVVPMGIPDEDVPMTLPPTSPHADHGVQRLLVVLYIGTLARVRRLDMIARAFALVAHRRPDARLVIVGEGDVPDDRRALEDEIARLGIGARVTFTGQLPRKDTLEWVRSAAVCLSPYYPTFVLRSTSPTKLVEYMALGKSVVANDHPEQAQILRDSGAGRCTPWDESSFAQAILDLLDDSDEKAAARARGHRWVIDNRRYSVIASRLHRRYQSLAAPALRDAG